MMATQTKVSSLGQVVQEHIFKSHLTWQARTKKG